MVVASGDAPAASSRSTHRAWPPTAAAHTAGSPVATASGDAPSCSSRSTSPRSPFAEGRADVARHLIGCHVTQETMTWRAISARLHLRRPLHKVALEAHLEVRIPGGGGGGESLGAGIGGGPNVLETRRVKRRRDVRGPVGAQEQLEPGPAVRVPDGRAPIGQVGAEAGPGGGRHHVGAVLRCCARPR